MADYNKILEHIKISESRVATISRDIKDVEAEIKTLDGEIDIMRAKEKQLKEEISYKRKIVNEKDWELQSLKNRHDIWKNMLDEKSNIFDTKNEELVLFCNRKMQQNVWDTRISFFDETLEFLTKNDFLLNNDCIDNVIKNQQEKNKFIESISKMESKLNVLENKHSEMKGRYDLLKHLEKEKERLLEYEQSPDIISVQTKIDAYNKEMKCLELELDKYSQRAIMNPHDMIRKQQLHSTDVKRANMSKVNVHPKQNKDEVQSLNYENQSNRHLFIPKVPSFLIKKSLKKDNN